MNVALVGYGRMGKEVAQILIERGHKLGLIVDPQSGVGDATELKAESLKNIDGVIEFSLPGAVKSHAAIYAKTGVSTVVGTTGWEADRSEIKKLIAENKASFLYGSNFSIGAHIMFALVAEAARLIKPFDSYDIMLHEFHHKFKADSPSGTALSIADVILKNLPRKTSIQTQSLDRPIQPEELHVSSTRGGSIPGIHQVLLDSAADTIEISHTARNRSGFALGSVLALEWLHGKKGFFKVEEFIASVIADK